MVRIRSFVLLFCSSVLIFGCEQIHETEETSLPTLKSEVIVTEENGNINGINFFSCVTKEAGYKGKNDDLINGSIIMNEWPTELPWRYGSSRENTLLFIGLFSNNKTYLAWSKDLRKGGPFQVFSGFFGGHNQIYFDNATDSKVRIILGGFQLPDLNPHSHGRIMLTPGTYQLTIEEINKNGLHQMDNNNIIIEHAGKSDPYIYNISSKNIYTVKHKTYSHT